MPATSPLRRRLAIAVVLATSAVSAAPAAAQEACSRYADRTGSDAATGSSASPFRTAQRLVDSLAPGETGCLRAGLYDEQVNGIAVRFNRAGTSTAPIRLRSLPGERATVRGALYVPKGSPNVAISDLEVDGRPLPGQQQQLSVQIMASDTVFERNHITNERLTSCMLLGSNSGWGQAVRTVVRENVFRDCGNPLNGHFDHSIYAENVVDGRIVDNVFVRSSGWAIHLYPNAQRTLVAHNVIDGNGRGLIFAGEGALASSNNVVEQNIISNSTIEYNIQAWWGGTVGSGNVARANCLFNGRLGNIGSTTGFTATGNIAADPQYVDRLAGDLRLRPDSPCLAVVGYDTAAKLAGGPAAPAPEPQPAPTEPAPTEPAPTEPPAETTPSKPKRGKGPKSRSSSYARSVESLASCRRTAASRRRASAGRASARRGDSATKASSRRQGSAPQRSSARRGNAQRRRSARRARTCKQLRRDRARTRSTRPAAQRL